MGWLKSPPALHLRRPYFTLANAGAPVPAEAAKIQDFNGVWIHDLAILVRRSNQLSYEATDVGSWSFVGSNFPVRSESMNKMIYEMNHILNCGY